MKYAGWIGWLVIGCGERELPGSDCRPADRIAVFADRDGDGVGGDPEAAACTLGQGQVRVDGDCDDNDAAVGPGGTETCDGRDEDCDGEVDEDLPTHWRYTDADGDGFGDDADRGVAACQALPGRVERQGDCDDGERAVNPDAIEVCDPHAVDEDCDGRADDDDDDTVGGTGFYVDLDADGFGDPALPLVRCVADGVAAGAGDCDDTTATVNPAAAETCDGRDDDCDGEVDEDLLSLFYRDQDGDGWGTDDTTKACDVPNGYAMVNGDCDDATWTRSPDAEERCDGADDDCDGLVDADDPDVVDAARWYPDEDSDGFGVDTTSVLSCSPVLGSVTGPVGDCDDADPAVGRERDWLADGDGDGVGAGQPVATECADPGGGAVPAARLDDCDDGDGGIAPWTREVCGDGIDQDCSGRDADCQVWLYTLLGANLARVDASTGTVEEIGPLGMVGRQAGLAFDPETETLYAAGTTDLYTIDAATGAATAVGPHGQRDLVGLTWDADQGHLLAVCELNSLCTVDPTTGVATPLVRLGAPLLFALAWDAVRHELVAWQSSTGILHAVDPLTGAATALQYGGAGPYPDPMSLGVDPLSDRYVGLAPDPFGDTPLYGWDPQTFVRETSPLYLPSQGYLGLVWVEAPPN